MIELQPRRAVHPGHEGRHHGAVGGVQPIGRSAVQRLLRHRGLQGIQPFVQVHHEMMQAIRALPGVGHGGYRFGIDQVVLSGGTRGQQSR